MPNDSCRFPQSFEPNILKPKKSQDNLGFSIPVVSGIPDSLFQSPGFQIPQTKISQIRESGFPCMGEDGIKVVMLAAVITTEPHLPGDL